MIKFNTDIISSNVPPILTPKNASEADINLPNEAKHARKTKESILHEEDYFRMKHEISAKKSNNNRPSFQADSIMERICENRVQVNGERDFVFPDKMTKMEKQHLQKITELNKISYQLVETHAKNVGFNENLKFFVKGCIHATQLNKLDLNHCIMNTAVKDKYVRQIEGMCSKQRFTSALNLINRLSSRGIFVSTDLILPLIKSIIVNDYYCRKYFLPRFFVTIHNMGYPITMLLRQLTDVDEKYLEKLAKYIAEYLNVDMAYLKSKNFYPSPSSEATSEELEYIPLECSSHDKMADNIDCIMNIDTNSDLITENLINKAQGTLVHMGMKSHKKLCSALLRQDKSTINTVASIKPFNYLLEIYAKYGLIENMRYMYHMIKFLDIKPDVQTFAHFLECIGRHDIKPELEKIKFAECLMKEIEKLSYSLDDILLQGNYISDEPQYIIKAVKMVRPNFAPRKPCIIHEYDMSIFKDLPLSKTLPRQSIKAKHDVKEDTKRYNMPYAGLIDKSTFMNCLSEQLESEIGGHVDIKSIFNPTPNNSLDKKGSLMISAAKDKDLLTKFKDIPKDEKQESKKNQIQSAYCKKLDAERKKWQETLMEAFKTNLLSMKQEWEARGLKSGFQFLNLYPLLKILPPQFYVDLMLNEIEYLSTSAQFYSPSSLFLYKQMGMRINQKYVVHQKLMKGFKDKLTNIYDKFYDYTRNLKTFVNHIPRTLWNQICIDQFEWTHHLELDNQLWPSTYHIGLGRFLYTLILQHIKVEMTDSKYEKKTSPAFFSIFRQYSISQKEEFKPHPFLVKLFKESNPTLLALTKQKEQNLDTNNIADKLSEKNAKTLKFEPHMLPMLVPPIPWTSINAGGYLLNNSPLVRLSESWGFHYQILNKTPVKKMLPMLDSLSYLGMCPWIINQPILDTIIKIFNSNGNPALSIPPYKTLRPEPTTNEDLNHNDEMTNLFPLSSVVNTAPYPGNKKHNGSGNGYSNSTSSVDSKTESEMYSIWCDTLYKLSIANHLRDKIFWFPHNMDFRSRVYPIPPYFNHLTGDPFRSLLLFAKPQPLGPKGLKWLKLHLVNLTGTQKKKSIKERIEYIDKMLPTIINCAEAPLKEGNDWWMKADDPWQALACCAEISKAIKHSDHTKYLCHFPIHQDGSCNGLQHYAALGRDQDGGSQVNLIPSNRPQDVYTAVAENVEILRQKDAESGSEIAILLEGKITRKVVKQTVMTVVYGVTHYGAKEQIARQLEDIPDFDKQNVKSASIYLVENTFASIKKLFTATREIQDWFTDCAKFICSNTNLTLEWVTPIGFPVVQPYSKRTQMVLPKGFQHETASSLQLRSGLFEKPLTRKQKNAFPPNFIHSLDSTHMMLTAQHCQKAGINFVAVHDCFWTHPAHVETMNQLCREQFVLLHKHPIIENLSQFFVENYSYSNEEISSSLNKSGVVEDMLKFNQLLKKIPQKGSLQIDDVLKSTFFFS
ncbi:DNA-directed RNA polymerase, mitochondrial-like [Gordionus sp. m RMFG-2023]|uniref:DNA-directed RNA polymerase, mitochondrial-like n=1 Tax=Gordionus sp. m RMFG-2023 TaxID=3053472 RepID=UPI0031FCB6D9